MATFFGTAYVSCYLALENLGLFFPLMFSLSLHLVVDRRLHKNGYYVFLSLLAQTLCILWLPDELFCYEDNENSLYCDIMLSQLSLAALTVASHTDFVVTALSLGTYVVSMALRVYVVSLSSCVVNARPMLVLAIGACMHVVVLFLQERYIYMSYVTEHVLVPEQYNMYLLQRKSMTDIIHRFGSNVPMYKSLKLYLCHQYEKTSVLVIHISAADLIPNLVDESDIPSILLPLHEIIDNILIECDLLKVSEVSGVCTAVSFGESEFINSHNSKMTHKVAAVCAVLKILLKVNEFNLHYGVFMKVAALWSL